MKKSRKKSVLFFACIFVLMSCLILASALDVGGIRAKAAEILYAAGDINGDGEVNGKDLTRLSKYISGLNPEVLSEIDTNKDGSIDGKDITHLMRYIAGEIPDLSGNVYHSIVYYDELTGYNNEGYYSEATGLYTLPKLTAEGREFDGWYTDPDGKGKKVVFIPKGSTENLILYANWKLIEYKITYVDAPQHFNVETYTIENEVVFSDAQWNGLRFSHWTDADGKEITRIPKGTIGDITVTANWLYLENMSVPEKGLRKLWTKYDEENGHQVFVYQLGEIQHVVLKELDKQYKYYGQSISWAKNETVTFEDSVADETSMVVTNSVSKSREYIDAQEWGGSKSHSFEKGFSVGAEFGIGIPEIFEFKAGGQGDFHWTDTNENSWSKSTSNSEGVVTGIENTTSASSTVMFNHVISESFETTATIGENMPEGYYRYVYYGTVEVYAVVTYDTVSGNYRVDIFSIFGEDIGSMPLYVPTENSTTNIKGSSGLPYDIPFGKNEDGTLKELDEYMANAYYVNYDANGGMGSMYTSAHRNGEEHKLSENSFVKPGYTWTGWVVEGKDKAIGKDEVVSDLATNGETITVKAQWVANPYTVKYDANKPANASSNIQNMPQSSSCTYDTDLILPNAPKLTGWSFAGWYEDAACTKKIGNAYQTISTPNLAESGEVSVYAKWQPNSYAVLYDANGGIGSSITTMHEYDTSSTLINNGFVRENYSFCGWSTNKNDAVPKYLEGDLVKNLSTGETVTMYAVWVKTTSKLEFSPAAGTRADKFLARGSKHIDKVISDLEVEALLANGYTTYQVTISFDAQRNFAIQYNKAKLEIYTNSAIDSRTWETSDLPNNAWTKRTEKFNVSISDLCIDGSFSLNWYTLADGGSANDGWKLGTTHVTIKAVK